MGIPGPGSMSPGWSCRDEVLLAQYLYLNRISRQISIRMMDGRGSKTRVSGFKFLMNFWHLDSRLEVVWSEEGVGMLGRKVGENGSV